MPSISTHQKTQIRALIDKDEKIAAVKLYREITSVGLKEAKDAVEAIMRGEAITPPAPAQVGEPDAFLENRIKRLLAERKKIEAVKIYREAYNCGLKEAKDAVDLIQADMRREGYSNVPSMPAISNDPFAENTQRNRRFLILVFAIVLIFLAGVVFFFLAGNGF